MHATVPVDMHAIVPVDVAMVVLEDSPDIVPVDAAVNSFRTFKTCFIVEMAPT